jgi:hypothetical protein
LLAGGANGDTIAHAHVDANGDTVADADADINSDCDPHTHQHADDHAAASPNLPATDDQRSQAFVPV